MIEIRPMRKGEQERVGELLCDCYRWLGEREGLTSEQVHWMVARRGSLETVQRESQTEAYLVACEDGRVVGMVAVIGETITKLYVDPDRHRQGVGRHLFHEAQQVIQSGGFGAVRAGVTPSAVLFYEAMGMTITDRKPHGVDLFAGREVVLMGKQLT